MGPQQETGARTGDLTARARIRDAALVHFADYGWRGATMRGIAAAAGVSVGLVQHHFGNKEGLRAACDAFVVETFEKHSVQALSGQMADPDVTSAMFAASEPVTRYLARALVDDASPAAAELFDRLAKTGEAFLTSGWPDRMPAGSDTARERAAVFAAMHLGTIVLHRHLQRHMGVDPLASEHAHRIGAAIGDIYAAMGEFISSELGDTIRHSLQTHRQEHDDEHRN